ncbi:MAG: hypothetical protein RL391_657 [Actinomycetota bacterium]
MFGISVDSVKNIVTASSAAPLLVGVVIVLFVANKIAKLVILLIAIALGLVVFSQRSTIDECVDRISASATPQDEVCKVLGYDFKLDLKDPVSQGA